MVRPYSSISILNSASYLNPEMKCLNGILDVDLIAMHYY